MNDVLIGVIVLLASMNVVQLVIGAVRAKNADAVVAIIDSLDWKLADARHQAKSAAFAAADLKRQIDDLREENRQLTELFDHRPPQHAG